MYLNFSVKDGPYITTKVKIMCVTLRVMFEVQGQRRVILTQLFIHQLQVSHYDSARHLRSYICWYFYLIVSSAGSITKLSNFRLNNE